MSKLLDLTGKKFGRWTVVKRHPVSVSGSAAAQWVCACDCGSEGIVASPSLRTGKSQSCGCLRKEVSVEHGRLKSGKITSTYNVWTGMVAAYSAPTSIRYPYLGGVGIRVCEQWLSFKNFLNDMGEMPKKHALFRRDTLKNFSPDNCYWDLKSKIERSHVRFLTHEGKTQSLTEWAKELEMDPHRIHQRLAVGKTVAEAFQPVVPRRKRKAEVAH